MNFKKSKSLIIILVAVVFNNTAVISGNLYKTISAASCDSLIRANSINPDFVVLDVRTPSVWRADHLEAAINRNFYDADFNEQLNALPRHKIYLMHCQTGNRSAATFTMMKNLNFATVFEMSGGISAWKNSGFRTTAVLTPRLMLVSKSGLPNNIFSYSVADTLKLTVTNRGNDTLKFTNFSLTPSSEFLTDFSLSRKLNGSDDYQFSVFYNPSGLHKDSVRIEMASIGGTQRIVVPLQKTTFMESFASETIKIYPNPADTYFRIGHREGNIVNDICLYTTGGTLVKVVREFAVTQVIHTDDLPSGLYLVKVTSGGRSSYSKLIIKR